MMLKSPNEKSHRRLRHQFKVIPTDGGCSSGSKHVGSAGFSTILCRCMRAHCFMCVCENARLRLPILGQRSPKSRSCHLVLFLPGHTFLMSMMRPREDF